jgi:hypothetical protein
VQAFVSDILLRRVELPWLTVRPESPSLKLVSGADKLERRTPACGGASAGDRDARAFRGLAGERPA